MSRQKSAEQSEMHRVATQMTRMAKRAPEGHLIVSRARSDYCERQAVRKAQSVEEVADQPAGCRVAKRVPDSQEGAKSVQELSGSRRASNDHMQGGAGEPEGTG